MSTQTNARAEAPLLSVEGLQVRFPVRGDQSLRGLITRGEKAQVHAVEDVSFEVGYGETVGLVGESGSGKSTIGNALMRLVEPTTGSITLDGIDVVAAKGEVLKRVRRTASMVFQDPLASLDPRRTCREAVRDPMDIHRLHTGSGEKESRVRELIDLVGLVPGMLDRYPHELSGGQRQRLCIARALASDPQLVILDEATASLDVSVQAQVMNLLKDIQQKLGVSYIFIAHDLSAVEYMSHRVVVLYLGRTMEVATREELYRDPRHPYTQALMSAIPEVDPRAEAERERIVLQGDVPSPLAPPSGCVFRTRCPVAMPECAKQVPPPVRLSPTHRADCLLAEQAEQPGRVAAADR